MQTVLVKIRAARPVLRQKIACLGRELPGFEFLDGQPPEKIQHSDQQRAELTESAAHMTTALPIRHATVPQTEDPWVCRER
jgi:hypothetical protein